MKVKIPYGSDSIEFHIPDNNYCETISPTNVLPVEDAVVEIRNAINNPIGTEDLDQIVSKGESINIICDDITRPTPCNIILPVLLEKLKKSGIKNTKIKIIIALGSHRYMTENEMIQKVGRNVYNNYTVVNSEFKNDEDLVFVGKAPDGNSIFASKVAIESDIRIGIGNIVPHPAMGWSGGAKIIYPGVTSEKTVVNFHKLQGLSDENLFGMDDCPVRLNVEKWVDAIGLDFIINTILTPEFKIYRVVAGDYVKAHRKGVEFAKEVYGKKLKEKVDIIVVSSHPVDIDFWQSTKGYLCGDHGLKGQNGGTIILVSPNYEGIGPHQEYAQVIGDDYAERKLFKLYQGKSVEGDPLALSVGTCVSKIRQRRNLVVVSDGLKPEEAENCKIGYYPKKDIQRAINDVIGKYNNPLVSIITHGGETYVYSK